MSDFVIIEPEYPQLPRMLLEEAPSFGGSQEFARLDSTERTLPSVVCGSFARYLNRLYSEAQAGFPVEGELAETHRAIERLAESGDSDVVNTLVVEVLEHLDLTAEQLKDFRSRLGVSARALYDEWIEPFGTRST